MLRVAAARAWCPSMRMRRAGWRALAACAAAALAVAALGAALAWPALFDAVLATQMALTPTSLSYQKWVAPSVPIFMEIFMFNWTNPEEFPGKKPKFQQLGPYRFREIRQHVNVSFHPHNASVSYRTQRSWHFDTSSNGSLDDVVSTLNVIAASAIFRSRYWGFLQQKGLSLGLAMFSQHVAISKRAGELLFEGYEDPLLNLAQSLPASTTGGAPHVDRFGWFYGRNNSIDTDGYVTVSSGVSTGLPGQIRRWNYMESLPFYEGTCSQITGSAGEFLPRDLTPASTLTMFVPDLCRTVHLPYVSSGQFDGIDYHKFAMDPSTFDYSALSPQNACFCNGECMWGGVMNVSACRYGSPSFLSLPHFLHADQSLRDAVEGMEPDPDKHSFYFAVEPKLGVPLDVAGRFQFNVYIEPNSNIGIYENVPRMLFPMFWVQQAVTVDQGVMDEIRMVRLLADWGGLVCACLSAAFALLTLIATCCYTSEYVNPKDRIDKPKDEAELKLNPKLKEVSSAEYVISKDFIDRPNDEAKLKLNPM